MNESLTALEQEIKRLDDEIEAMETRHKQELEPLEARASLLRKQTAEMRSPYKVGEVIEIRHGRQWVKAKVSEIEYYWNRAGFKLKVRRVKKNGSISDAITDVRWESEMRKLEEATTAAR